MLHRVEQAADADDTDKVASIGPTGVMADDATLQPNRVAALRALTSWSGHFWTFLSRRRSLTDSPPQIP
jgi:hypothetical protein